VVVVNDYGTLLRVVNGYRGLSKEVVIITFSLGDETVIVGFD
jgi:hypothetical protein